MERIHQLVKRSESAPESVIRLLENTLIGTEGSLYRLLDTRQKIELLVNPLFIYIERNSKAIGNISICDRDITLGDKQFAAKYIRYFAFDSIFQGGSKKGNSSSQFHDYFKTLFTTNNLDPTTPDFSKSFFWAYIDPQNMRSFNMNERFGFETIGQFKTTSFSRKKPQASAFVERLRLEDKEEADYKLKQFYSDFNFLSDVHLFERNNFFVLKDEGRIVAGIQANPTRFKIESLPGFSGRMMLRALPLLPGIKKLINPKEHKFLATEGLFWETGFEHKVEELLEGVLSISQHHSLLIWTDEHNKMLEPLNIKWGLIQKIKKDNSVNIVAKINHFSAEEIDQIKMKKKYLSGFDMT